MAFGATDTWICSFPTTHWLYEPCSASVSASTKPGQGASHNTCPFYVLFPELKWASHGISAQTLTQLAIACLTLGMCHLSLNSVSAFPVLQHDSKENTPPQNPFPPISELNEGGQLI